MAANEDDSGSTRTITAAEPQGPTATSCAQAIEQVSEVGTEPKSESIEASHAVHEAEISQSTESVATAQLADLLQGAPAEQSIVVGPDITSLGNTTIIYVQPDGSLEGSGLTPEEQQTLLDQLTKQQIVQVSDIEAAQLLQQSPLVKTIPVQNTTLDPNQLQEVINQVTRSQQIQVLQQIPKQQIQTSRPSVKQHKMVQIPQQNLKTNTQNKSPHQLKSAAQQVTIQTGSSVHVLQKKVRSSMLVMDFSRLALSSLFVYSHHYSHVEYLSQDDEEMT